MKCFGPRSTTTQCAYGAMDRHRNEIATVLRSKQRMLREENGLLFYGVISALSEHWTRTGACIDCMRRAHDVASRVHGNGRAWCGGYDAHNHSRAGAQSIADQRIEGASEPD